MGKGTSVTGSHRGRVKSRFFFFSPPRGAYSALIIWVAKGFIDEQNPVWYSAFSGAGVPKNAKIILLVKAKTVRWSYCFPYDRHQLQYYYNTNIFIGNVAPGNNIALLLHNSNSIIRTINHGRPSPRCFRTLYIITLYLR